MGKTIAMYIGWVGLVGILLGVVTSFGQTYIPDPLRQLANSYSVWLLFSFIVGWLIQKYSWAAVAGVAVQYLAIVFYYVASSIRFDFDLTLSALIANNVIWIIGGTLVGPVAAIAGMIVKNKTRYLPIAIGFMVGLFISEALYQFIILQYVGEGVVFSIVAAIFAGVMYFVTKYNLLKVAVFSLLFTSVMYVGYAHVLGAIFS